MASIRLDGWLRDELSWCNEARAASGNSFRGHSLVCADDAQDREVWLKKLGAVLLISYGIQRRRKKGGGGGGGGRRGGVSKRLDTDIIFATLFVQI